MVKKRSFLNPFLGPKCPFLVVFGAGSAKTENRKNTKKTHVRKNPTFGLFETGVLSRGPQGPKGVKKEGQKTRVFDTFRHPE